MARRKDGEETKAKILEAAYNVFGHRGYHDGTHAEICRQAGVNTAAINYHFGEKAALYRATFDHASQQMAERHPLSGNLPKNASAQVKLHAAIKALVGRALDPHMSRSHQIFVKEIFDPTGLIDDALMKKIHENRTHIRAIVKELLGEKATERDIDMCELSVAGQCRTLRQNPLAKKPLPDIKFTQEEVKTLAEHITQFSLAGIREKRREIMAR